MKIDKEFCEIRNHSIKIQMSYQDILEEIPNHEIEEYAHKYLDMEVLSEATKANLIEALDNYDYDYASKVSDEEMIEYLESDGWEVTMKGSQSGDGLDYLDQTKLDEIIKLFVDGSWIERDVIYNRVRNG